LAYVFTIAINILMIKYSDCDADESSSSSSTSDVTCTTEEQYSYMPSNIYTAVMILGSFHLVFSIILMANFLIGNVPAIIAMGWKWKKMIESKLLEFDSPQDEQIFNLARKYLPIKMWSVYFAMKDFWVWYYAFFLLFSILGLARSPVWFAFHVVDICTRVRVLTDVFQALTANIKQVIATLVLGIIFCYMFAVYAIGAWGWNNYEFGDGGGGIYSLSDGFLQHIDYGLRGPPAWTVDDQTAHMYFYDFFYNMLIILIMVAIITGIIIDTFADKRSAMDEIENDIKNVCFICSLNRDLFDRKRIPFNDHVSKDHNAWNYVYYRMYLEGKAPSELTAIEKQLKEKINKQDIGFFPIQKALVLEREEEEEDDQTAAKIAEIQDTQMAMQSDLKKLFAIFDQVQNGGNTVEGSEAPAGGPSKEQGKR